MNAVELSKSLRRLGACHEAREWANGKSLAEVHEQLHRADWWLWLAAKAGVDRKRVVLAACACARTALKHVPAGELRPLAAIETAERWARGDTSVSLEDVKKAARAADAAAAAAYAAADAAAAYAAYAADAAAAYAAAAYATADAAAYAAADAAAATRKKALADMVPLVKEHTPLEVVLLALTSRDAP